MADTELEGRKSCQPQKRLELDLRRHLEPGGVPSSEATAFTNMPFSGAQLLLTWDTPTPFNGYLELQFKELCFDPCRYVHMHAWMCMHMCAHWISKLEFI